MTKLDMAITQICRLIKPQGVFWSSFSSANRIEFSDTIRQQF